MSKREDFGIISHECNHCGKCCQRRGELSLTPLDVFNISQYIGITTKNFIDEYCEIGNGFDVCIRSNESTNKCIFFSQDFEGGKHCLIYDVRPMTCYLYPLKSRPESRDAFFIDSAASCPISDENLTFSEYVLRNSKGRYSEDFTHYQKFCMAIGAFYSDRNSPSQAEMFKFLFYNSSAEEIKQKLNQYLFGK